MAACNCQTRQKPERAIHPIWTMQFVANTDPVRVDLLMNHAWFLTQDVLQVAPRLPQTGSETIWTRSGIA